ncbi:MAG: hypothetical protein L3J35_03140 [Bacteroidales bacterium]|nr:hypothetical protein [Bacteroidales bacterium]
MNFTERLKKNLHSKYVILLFIIAIPFVNFNHHNYSKDEGVIVWDIKSYYAYLPATFIYNDLSFEFTEKNNEIDFNKWIWTMKSPKGKKTIKTSIGLSILYSPFFFIGHAVAKIHPKYNADGYSLPYHIALTFSAYIYFILALFILRKVLLKFYDDKITALTLFFIGAGTNLFYYVTYEAPMSHSYNFFLITLFVYLLIKWHDSKNIKNSIFLGLTGGLIALVRPTNIIILLLIPLYGVTNFKTLKESIANLLKHWHLVLVMVLSFVIIWIPQFAYWFYVSGKILYFSYGESNEQFFFNNPQITNFLFSYKKGWFIYTPLMLFATFGFFALFKDKNKFSTAILTVLILNIYILSSWWSWWFGGSFGQRSMVDMYGLTAIPLAALLTQVKKNKIINIITITILFTLTAFNQFQIQQYRKGAIHFWWMSKEAYWENFLHLNATCKYWKIAQRPDYDKARKGIYEFTHENDRNAVITDEMLVNAILEDVKSNKSLSDSILKNQENISTNTDSIYSKYAESIIKEHKAGKYFKQLKINHYTSYINNCSSWKKEVERKAKKQGISYKSALINEANSIYNNYSEKYTDTF